MAENINEQLEDIGFVNLGVKARPNLVVLKRTKMPAVLVEVGFINSDVDNKLFDEILKKSHRRSLMDSGYWSRIMSRISGI